MSSQLKTDRKNNGCYREEMIQSIIYSVDIQNRFPIFSQDIEANVAFQVYIWMEDLKERCKFVKSQTNHSCQRQKGECL